MEHTCYSAYWVLLANLDCIIYKMFSIFKKNQAAVFLAGLLNYLDVFPFFSFNAWIVYAIIE